MLSRSVLLLSAALLLFAAQLSADVAVGQKAPDFSLPSVDGKSTIHLADFTSKPTLLVFYTAVCPHCVAEAPVIQRVFVDLRGKGLNVVGVGIGDNRSAIGNFVAKNKLTYPNAFGSADKGKEVATAYGLKYVPVVYLIGKDGKVKAVWTGEVKEKSLRSALAEQGVK